MQKILNDVRISLKALFGLGILLTVIYPVIVWGIGQLFFHDQANGSLRLKDGKIIGSALLGQNFSSPQYFHTRPSAAGKGYDAANSSGSNLGPISGRFLQGVADDVQTKDVDESFSGLKQRVENYRKVNGLSPDIKIPADAVTASGSGLDPHISIRNAELQLPRVARERGLSEEVVRMLIEKNIDKRGLGILGEPGVNVLMLNLALDTSGRQVP